jgi:hypothetical protein
MQSKEITGLIQSQIPFDNGTLSRLANVLEEYPYFQAARLLYTLNLQANKDTQLPAEIRKTACYATDRKRFFYRMESDFQTLWQAETGGDEKPEESDLIGSFLAQKESEMKDEQSALPGSQLASTDYLTHFFPEEKQSPLPNVPPMQHQDKIDRFISKDEQSGVRITLDKPDKTDNKKTKEETPLQEIDKEIGNTFFSETLAKIYLKQKKYNKALEIIIKLSLVYPEKSAYFADQIRFLEKLIINIPK